MPIRHVAGNVIWTLNGTVWGLWRVQGADQTHATATAKARRLHALESLVKKLHGESMWLSLCPQVDPRAVVRQMTEGINMPASERYTELAHRVLDELEQLELTGRTDWLAVPLPAVNSRQAVREVVQAARAEVALQLGLLPAPVSRKEEERRVRQAGEVSASWPGSVKTRAATESEILWIYGHSARRGVLEPLLPPPDEPRGIRGRGRGVAAFGQAVLSEGAVGHVPDPEDRDQEGAQLFRRRWLQVATEWGDSYQAFLTLSEMPESFRFPGSEYLAALDTFAFPVDWVMRLSVTAGARAEPKTRRQARELAGQPEEYAQDPAGAPANIEKAGDSLAEYRERLTSSATEVEVRAMGAFCVWGSTPQEAEERATALAGDFGSDEYTLARPLGEQERLFYGMLPGARTPQVMTQYSQFLLARDFCMAAPFAATELGDERGPLYGFQMSGGGVRPVLVDWSRGPAKQTSASAAFIGELGGGKSVAMKAAVYWVLAAGRKARRPGSRGRAVMVDRTPKQEWLRFARSCPGSVQSITIDKSAEVSLDPLRVFTRVRGGVKPDLSEAQRLVESFLGMLLGIRPMDELGDVLSETVAHVLASARPSMRALLQELTRRGQAGDASSETLARKLAKHDRRDLAKAVFDPSLPVLDTDADAVVFSVSNLALPKVWELAPGHFERLSPEKVFGRAALYLIATICRDIAFDPRGADEFCAVVWDECWWLTSSPEGLDLLLELVKDGRKHNSGVLVGSHDAHDIGPDNDTGQILRGLFPRRHLFRHTSKNLARRGLTFLDLDPNDSDLVELVTTQLSPLDESDAAQAQRAGECLVRDLFGRVGGMRVKIPLDPQAAEAIHSDPGSTGTDEDDTAEAAA